MHQIPEFIQRMRTRIAQYGFTEISDSCLDLLATRTSALHFGARYALAVAACPICSDYRDITPFYRSIIARELKALWLFREVGCYIVLYGKEDSWRYLARVLRADMTGLHAVIIQAIHFVDPETKNAHLVQSRWGPISFGGGIEISSVIDNAIQETHLTILDVGRSLKIPVKQ
jgi:hypothetical protein